jgi:branched-chain amino acid transport system substrate-binding protein
MLTRTASQTAEHVVIAGAGISAFGGVSHLVRQCPGTDFAALQPRHSFGGTRIACRQAAMRRAGAVLAALTLLAAIPIASPAAAQKAGGRGGEIRIGNTMPYSGPASAYGLIGKTIAAYFNKINAEGGIKGRRINFISYDDSYNPAKTVELTRKLVEDDQVLLIFASLGTAPSAAVRPYLNANKVPQLFVASGASMWDQPREFPWTFGFQPSYQTEGHIYAQYLLENHTQGKIAILYQDDEFGKDYVKGLKDGLAGKIPVVAEAAYKVTDSSIDPQIARLRASGADIFFNVTTPKFASKAIRRAAELGWKPEHIVPSVSESVGAVLEPAGLQNAEGLLSAGYMWEVDDTAAAGDPGYAEWLAFMDRYLPGVDKTNSLTIYGYTVAGAMVEVLKRCGDDFSRDNVMRQAAALKSLRLPMLLPGILINTSATDHAPLEQMVVMRFSAGRWEHTGPVRSGVDPGAVSDGFKAIFRYGSTTRQTAGQQNANTVTMMTGAFGGTYVQIGADLATVLDDGANFRLLPVVGRGSVQAVADILFLKGVDVGIVRKDTLAYLERKGYANNIRNELAYVAKLYAEEMHVVAPKAIRSMQDLDGKSVAVDLPDGGTFVTSINVFERLGIKPHLIYVEPRIALEMLRKGEIDAIIAVEGKPVQWLSQLSDPNLHLVPVDYARSLRDDYLPTQLTADDYPNLIAPGQQVDTLASEAILASYNWQPSNSDRYRRVARLVDTFFSHVAQLQQPPFHPKWRELAIGASVSGWTRARPAQEWLDKNAASAANATSAAPVAVRQSGAASIEQNRVQFGQFLDERAATRGSAAASRPEGREAIFNEFLQWQASRSVRR